MINEYVKITTVSEPGYFFAGVIGSVIVSNTKCLITTIGIVAQAATVPITPEMIVGCRGISYNSDAALYLPVDWSHKQWFNDTGEIKRINRIDFEHVKAFVAKDGIATKPVYIMQDGTTSWMITEVL